MDEQTQNKKIYKLLKNIQDNPKSLVDKDISREEETVCQYIKSKRFVTNLNIEEYYSGPVLNAENCLLTDEGFAFLRKFEEQTKPIRMTKKNRYLQLQILLERIEDADKELLRPNPRVKKNDYADLIEFAIDNKFVKGISTVYASDSLYAIIGKPRITSDGYEILDIPFDQISTNQQTLIQIFNFNNGDFKGSTFGNNNEQHNKER
ncbi:hypothetical protein P7D40_12335 [Enterococcus dongliensis]|uniref:hypothetical protein n=1 Tax=Enterococcus dongliensis TaxID=2559925 RepID=UPI0028920CBA|nr:hypothetical protein [Enterococcus dongliensis]MDT2635671.1 hypothetical protein [Enterococcus dongliensis]